MYVWGGKRSSVEVGDGPVGTREEMYVARLDWGCGLRVRGGW